MGSRNAAGARAFAIVRKEKLVAEFLLRAAFAILRMLWEFVCLAIIGVGIILACAWGMQ